jgi:hypothetical protein
LSPWGRGWAVDPRRNSPLPSLDRALANDNLLSLFGEYSVQHVQTTPSDHCALLVRLNQADQADALLVRLNQSDQADNQTRERPFRYENMWHATKSMMRRSGTLGMEIVTPLQMFKPHWGDEKYSEILG